MAPQHPTRKKTSEQPDILARPDHPISRKNIDPDCLKVLYRLKRFGHTAYLVGGSVRDLLLGRRPKDFDVGTDATPRRIRKLFRNCYLVGRRFKLAHIKFGPTIIETSTFRRKPEELDEAPLRAADHRAHRDNAFGTPAQDAKRRDFTVNALFYDIKTFSVIDHVGGFEDLKQGLIRCIGDPDLRFQEDPVRMIRAVRFAAKLGFDIEGQTWQAIQRHKEAILTAAPSRLMEEILRLYTVQATTQVFRLMLGSGLLGVMFPEIARFLDKDEEGAELFWKVLGSLDRFEAASGEVPASARLAATFFPQLYRNRKNGNPAANLGIPGPETNALCDAVARRFQMPRKLYYRMLLILAMQKKLSNPPGKKDRPPRMLRHPWFPEALVLHGVIVEALDKPADSVTIWQGLLGQDDFAGPKEPAAKGGKKPRARRRRQPRRRSGKPQFKRSG